MGGPGFQQGPGNGNSPFLSPFAPKPPAQQQQQQQQQQPAGSFLSGLRLPGGQTGGPAGGQAGTSGGSTKADPTSELPISPVTPATAAPTSAGNKPTPVEMGPITTDKVQRDTANGSALGDQRTPGDYHITEVHNPDGTITICSDNIHVTVRPVDGFKMPTDPKEKQAVLDAAYKKKAQDDKAAYGKTADDMRADALAGGDKNRYFDSEQHWMWAIAASARTGGQIPPEYFMKLDPYGGTAGNGPQIQPGGGAGQVLSTIAMAHDTDWDLGRYFNAGPLSSLHDLSGVDPRYMGEVGLFGAGVDGRAAAATQGANFFNLPKQGQVAMDNAPRYVDPAKGLGLNPATPDWKVQYSKDYVDSHVDPGVVGNFIKPHQVWRGDLLFDKQNGGQK